MIDKLHKTISSLLKKHYTIEFYTENYFTIILSFYHLNSVYNGLCYINKDSGNINIDFQYHAVNKLVHEQVKRIAENVYKLYKLNQFNMAILILNSYKQQATEIFNNYYSLRKYTEVTI